MTYAYDSLKRLIKAETTQTGGLQWGQSFGYDDFGNLTTKTPTTGHTGTSMSLSIDQNTNHVTMSGFAYDANGNMTSIPSTPQNINLTYDTENRTGGTWYDQQNQPLDRTGAPGVWYLYGLNGERMGTYTYSVSWTQYPNPNGTGYVYLATVTQTQVSRNIYFGGHLIQSNGTTVVLDRLGSVRANENGETFEYYPYGEEITIKNPQDREKFGMYTRESSTGLDYADQRYYSSIYGQFGRSDMGAGSTPQSPLTWNGYRYATGDPINAGYPTGLYGCGLVFADEGDESDAGLGCFAAKPGSVDFVYPTKYYTPCPPYGIALSFLPDQGCAALIEAQADNGHPSPQPMCDISFYSQNIFGIEGGFLHTYIQVSWMIDNTTTTKDFEGIPVPSPGRLLPTLQNAQDLPNGGNYYKGGTSNLLFDLGAYSTCSEANSINDLATSYPNNAYTYMAPYNSSSFTYSLFTYSNTPVPSAVNSYLLGLASVSGFPLPVPRGYGWGLLIPGWTQ